MVVTGAVAATTTFYLRHSSTPPSLLVTAALGCLKPQKLPPTHFTFLSCCNNNVKASPLYNTMSEQDGGKLDNLRSDIDKLETMTVKDLRQIMREVGIPTKGSKKDLVSALSSFLHTEEDCENTASRTLQPQQSNKMSLKRKVEGSLSEDVATISPKSTKIEEKKKSRGKIQAGGNGRISEETSVVENETIDTKDCPTSKKASKKISRTTRQASSVIVKTTATTSLGEPWTVLTHKKPQPGWLAYDPKTMRPPPLREDVKSVKLMSWNVNGLRALLKAEGFSALQLAQRENFDVLCLQETKIQEKDVDKIKDHLIEGYDNSFWTCSNTKLGYSGTAIVSRIKPISVKYGLGIKDHDGEGRLVTLEFDEFYVLCGYVPNSGDGLRRLEYRIKEWDPSLSKYMKELEKSKPVILTGDLNCAHEEMDIYNPAGNRRSAGFTDEERESFKKNFLSNGFVDTFRKQHPSAVGYTYYGYRHGGRKTNRGWRLDYFLVSECITDQVHDSYILPDIGGSDHCPIGLVLKV